MSEDKFELRVVTYMSPSHPVELYELILELLEEAVDCHAVLQYETRSPGPIPGRPNPFVNNKTDLGRLDRSMCAVNSDVHSSDYSE